MKYQAEKVKLSQLILDKDNPRFAELYNGSDNESDIIEYLLYTESAEEVAEAISRAQEFYVDRPLWVIKDKDNYIVKDGNRRCAAVKALQNPVLYGLALEKYEIKELPVLVYHNAGDVNNRIRLEHNSNLFKKWGRIAKALEIHRLYKGGSSIESLTDIDSQPKDFIKLASFYKEAVEIQGEQFKQLVREGKGNVGGKTIIFERLFKEKDHCGYSFKRNTGEIDIKDKNLFKSYIDAITQYLINNPKTTSREVDNIGTSSFLGSLKIYGYPPLSSSNTVSVDIPQGDIPNDNITENNTPSIPSQDTLLGSVSSNPITNTPVGGGNANSSNLGVKKHSVKTKPDLKRKKIPSSLKRLIDECFNIDKNQFPNAKTALTRVTFECVLKYIVENTLYTPGKEISSSNYFRNSFYDRHGKKLVYINFTNLKGNFTDIITNTGIRQAFNAFNLETPHQIIHNYHVCATATEADTICGNLIPLIEFMLQEEIDLLNSLDITKL